MQKTILITGATRGIGRALLEHYASQGEKIIGIYRNSTENASELERKYENQIDLIQMDLADSSAILSVCSDIQKRYTKLDLLVNNAGIYKGGSIQELSENDYDEIMAVNIKSKYLLTKSLLPLLTNAKSASRIVNISSRFAFCENVYPDTFAYNLSNAAILMLTKSMQVEFANIKVKVGAFIPTVTETDRFYSAFTEEERIELKEKGIVASSQDTAMKIVQYVNTMSGADMGIDARVGTGPKEFFNFCVI